LQIYGGLGSITSTIKGILQQIHLKIKVVFRPTHHMNIILNNKMMRQQNTSKNNLFFRSAGFNPQKKMCLMKRKFCGLKSALHFFVKQYLSKNLILFIDKYKTFYPYPFLL